MASELEKSISLADGTFRGTDSNGDMTDLAFYFYIASLDLSVFVEKKDQTESLRNLPPEQQ